MAAEIFRNSYDQKIEPDTSKPPHRVSHPPQADTTPAWVFFLPCKVAGSSVYWKHTTFPRATGGKRYVEAGDQVG